MKFLNLVKRRRWMPNLERTPPQMEEWPDYVVTFGAYKFTMFGKQNICEKYKRM